MIRRIRGGLRAVLDVRRVQLVLAIVASMLFSVACGERGDGGIAGGGDDACEFAGSTSEPKIDPAGGPFEITEVVHEVVQDDCEETVTFSFGSLPADARPGYHVFYRRAPIRGPDGQEVEVDGESILEIVLFDASDGTEPTLAGNDGLVVDIVKPPEVPGGSLWLLGLEEERPFTVRFERTPRSSLVVSVGAPDDGDGP